MKCGSPVPSCRRNPSALFTCSFPAADLRTLRRSLLPRVCRVFLPYLLYLNNYFPLYSLINPAIRSTMAPKITPWAVNGESDPSLRERIAQITAERGHFRHITEESLQAETAAEESGQPSQSASDDEAEDGDADDNGQPATRQGK